MKITEIKKYLAILILIAIVLLAQCQWKNQKADLILLNGIFYTVNEFRPEVQAVAVKDDRILAIGNNKEMDQFRDEKTQVIDLNGLFGCPGFNDAHLHLLRGGQLMLEANLIGVRSVREIQKQVFKKLNMITPGSWLTGRGWDQTLLPGGKWPTKRILDIISPDIPIYLKRVCGHVALVNSKALNIAGITDDTPNPPGGEIEKDPITGMPTGILKEEAMKLVSQYIPNPSEETIKSAIEIALDKIRKFGVTSVQDYSSSEISLNILNNYQEFLNEGKLTCRISVWFPLKEEINNIIKYRKICQKYNKYIINFGLLKGVVDGSMGSRTAAFFEPYLEEPATRGIARMNQEELNRLVVNVDRKNFQVGIHAIGDKANRMVLDAYEFAQKMNGIRDSRHRIEHAQVLTKEDILRFKEFGIIASMQPVHCIEDMRWAEKRIGQERCRFAYAWRSLKNSGAIIAFGTDWPVSSLNPMLGVYAAVTRRDTLGYPLQGWFPQERLTIKEAIEAYTMGSAYGEFMEKEKGSLEPGKLADIVVLDRNILTVSPKDILKSKVVYTILGGQIVYQGE